MKIQRCNTMLPAAACILVLLLCSCSGERDPNAPYSSGFDNASLVVVEQEDGYPALRFPADQLVVYPEDDVTHEEFLELLESIPEVTLIGQAPASGIYQLEVQATTRAELDRVRETLLAYDEIEGTVYNLLMAESEDVGSCPAQPDVMSTSLSLDDQLPYYLNTYITALEIMQGVRELITLSPVTIGITERGYNNNGEFNDITIENASESNARGVTVPLDRTSNHGCYVAGIICADNDGSTVNGLASTLIGEHLRVVMANPPRNTAASLAAAQESLILKGGARIINSSWGFGPYGDNETQVGIDCARTFRRILNRFPDVLFCFPAGNEAKYLNGENYGPGGVQAPNSITVSSWAYNNSSVRHSGHNFGDVVDMSGPGVRLNVVSADGTIYHRTGTSLSTPMVASAAALLKSIDPSLSPGDIKILLTNPTHHDARTEPGGGIQLSFAHPLVDLLWDLYGDTAWGEQLMADPDGDASVPPLMVKSRICEDSWVQVEEYGDFVKDDYADCEPASTMIMPSDGSSWFIVVNNLSNLSGDLLDLSIQNNGTAAFALHTPLEPEQDALFVQITANHLLGPGCIAEDPIDGDFYFKGGSTFGTYEFTNCFITERTRDGSPKYLTVDVEFEATIDGYHTIYYPSDYVLPIDIQEMRTQLSGCVKDVFVASTDPFGFYDESVELACTDATGE